MPALRRTVAIVSAAAMCAIPLTASAATGKDTLRAKIIGAFNGVKSYKLTVLGSVRSNGVFVKPDRYAMTTTFQGKPIKTVIIGSSYWLYSGGKWQKSGSAPNTLDVDIAGLLRNAQANPNSPFVAQPDQTQDGKKVGTFMYTFKNGAQETCNYDKSTYRATRCKGEELTLLYSGYNDPRNTVAKLH